MRSNRRVFHFAPFMGRRTYIAREIAHHLLPRDRSVGRRDAARARAVVYTDARDGDGGAFDARRAGRGDVRSCLLYTSPSPRDA